MPGLHFLPEDAPQQIADALDDWIAQLPRDAANTNIRRTFGGPRDSRVPSRDS